MVLLGVPKKSILKKDYSSYSGLKRKQGQYLLNALSQQVLCSGTNEPKPV